MPIAGHASAADPLWQQWGGPIPCQANEREQPVLVFRGERFRFGHARQLTQLVHADSVGGCDPQQEAHARLTWGGSQHDR